MSFRYWPALIKEALCVGIYDTVVGLWPLISMDSFTAVTSLGTHHTLVRAIAALWVALGLALLFCVRHSKILPFLGIASIVAGTAAAVAELVLTMMRLISPIFLVHAACECIVGLSWIVTLSSMAMTARREFVTSQECIHEPSTN